MKIFKMLSLLIVVVAIIVIGGATYLVTTFDANHYKKQIIAQVKKQTGRTLALPGDVDLKFFPDIALTLGEAKLSSAKGFGNSDFATIKGARIAVGLMPLLNRQLSIKEVRLDGLNLALLTKADGTTSWQDLQGNSTSKNSDQSSQPNKTKNKVVEDLLESLSIAGLSLRDATINWHDIPKAQKITISSLDLKTGIFKQGRPLDVTYSVQVLQHNPVLKVAAKGKTTVTLADNNQHFTLKNLLLDLQASGDQIPNGKLALVLKGDVSGSAQRVKAPNLELQLMLDGDLIPEGKLDTTLKANVDANFQLSKITLEGLNLKTNLSGSYVDNGALEALLKGDVLIDLGQNKITAPTLDLTTYLKGGYAKGGKSSAHLQANVSFDIASNYLQLSGVKFKGDLSGKLLQGKGHTQLDGKIISYDLNKQALLINGLKLTGGISGDLLKGTANTDITSQQLSLDLKSQILQLKGLQLKGDIKGKLVKGGSATTQLSSQSLQYHLDKQGLTIVGLKGNIATQGGMLKKGRAHSTIATDLQFNGIGQVLKLSQLELDVDANGELLSGMSTKTHLKGNLQIDLTKMQASSSGFNLQGSAANGLLEQSKLNHQSKGSFDINWEKLTGVASLEQMQLNVDDATLKGTQVKLESLNNKPRVSGHFNTNVIQLRPLLKRFAIKLPEMSNSKAVSTLKASFQLVADKDSADLQNIRIKLDDSSIQGRFAVQDFANPLFKPDLTIDKLNLDGYLPPKGKKTPESSSISANVSVQSGGLLPVETLRGLRVKGGIKIGSLYFNNLSFSNLVAKVNADKGLIKLDPLNTNLYEGRYNGNMTINVQKSVPQISMHHVLTELHSGGFLYDLFKDKYISGKANLVTDLNTQGNSIDALLGNLSGATKLSFNDGTIRDSKFAEKVSLAVNAFEKKSVEGGKTVVKFTGLSGDWKVSKGVFTTSNFQLLSPYFRLEGEGTANMGKQTMDILMRIGPKSKGDGKRLYAPLRAKGPFDNLSFSLDLKDLLKTLAQQDIEEAKRKAKERLNAEKLKLKQKLADEKLKLKLKLDTEKQAAQQKLIAEKNRAKQRLAAEKEKYQLKWKAEQAALKTKAAQALKKKLGEDAAAKLKQKLSDNVAKTLKEKLPESVNTEKLKDVEDKLKDKLKNKFKGLF